MILLKALCIFVLGGLSYQLQAQKIEQDQKRKIALQLLNVYSPSSYAMLMEYESSPGSYMLGGEQINLRQEHQLVDYIHSDTIVGVIGDLNQAIHEISHGYANRLPLKYIQKSNELFNWSKWDEHYAFYLNGEALIVPITEVFPVKDIRNLFPDELQTFRFPTYIFPSQPNLNTQINGVYGLLNEMIAYYHGTRVVYELYNYFDQHTKGTPHDWLEFLANVNSTYYAHLEFKLYILKYLLYAKGYHPKIYKQILQNVNFKRAYSIVDSQFAKMNDDYFKLKDDIVKKLRKAGYKVNEDDEYIIIRGENFASGRGNFMKTYKVLKKELEKEDYKEIQALLNE